MPDKELTQLVRAGFEKLCSEFRLDPVVQVTAGSRRSRAQTRFSIDRTPHCRRPRAGTCVERLQPEAIRRALPPLESCSEFLLAEPQALLALERFASTRLRTGGS